MNRRSVTLVVSGVVLVALFATAALFPVPYVVYSPGPTADTLGEFQDTQVVQIEGAQTFPTTGELDLTTVGVTSADRPMDLFSAMSAWVDPDRAVVPRELVYPPGTTAEQSRAQNAQLLVRSEETAKVAALRALGYEVTEEVVVDSVVNDAPADGVLEPGDVIESVGGEPIETPQDVVDVVTAQEPGEALDFEVLRDDEPLTASVTTTEAPDDGRTFVGFAPAPGFGELPVDITIGIDERIGGPSAGMIFAVAIYDTLTEGDLLQDLHVAGTGEITADGDVGPIGGIPQKIAAASAQGADLFLAPIGNCDEAATAHNRDMVVTPVETLQDSLDAIEAATSGDLDSLPRCEV